jgi:tetratricopeptide (TPR) repeat protein
MRQRHTEQDRDSLGDSHVLLTFDSDELQSEDSFSRPFQVGDTEPFADADVTPPVDTFRNLERDYVKGERWQELVQLLVERAGQTDNPAERSRCLVRAAQLFDTNLADVDRAVVTLLQALRENPASDDVSAELARLATVHNRWDDLMAQCNRMVTEISPDSKRAELLVTIAFWYERHLEDMAAAEAALEAAMSADPTNITAVRSLVLLHGQRGDWNRAAAYLTCAAGNAIDPLDSVDYALDAAEIYRDQLHDSESAVVQYMRVLSWSPDHPKAVAALADAAWERKDWTAASSLLEGMAGSAKNAMEDTAQLWYKAAWSAQMTGDFERARSNYRKAYGAMAGHLPTLQSWSQLSADRGWWQDLLTTVPRLLAIVGDSMPGEERAAYLMRLGQAHVALRDVSAGTHAFMEALRLAPELPGARQALAKATAQMEGRGTTNAQALVEQYRVLLHGHLSTDERFDIICNIGRLQREELNDLPAALGSYLQALQLRPDDIGVLHELVELHTVNRHWSRAVDVLERLVSLTSGREKVCYLVALASILNSELDSPDEAVALYDRALDEDPSDRRVFEHIENILIYRRNWRELTRAYRRMIKRLGPNPAGDRRPWLLALWRALADTCRRYLRDFPAAAAAFEVCVGLAPEDFRQREALAEAYEAQGRDGIAAAVATREHLLSLAEEGDSAAKQIRALARLFGHYHQYDALFCTSAALCALTKADVRERGFYETNAPRGVPLARTFITERQWQGHLCSSIEDRLIAQVLAAAAPALITARAKEASAYGIEARHRAALETDRSFVSRLLVYTSRLLGVPLPPVYVPPGAPGEMDLVVLLEEGRPVPALVLGRDLVIGRTHQELTFLITKKLVGLRADHFLLWPQLVPRLDELRVVFCAAIKLVQPRFELPGTDPAAVRKYVSYLTKMLPAAHVDLIAAAAAPLLAGHTASQDALRSEGFAAQGFVGDGQATASEHPVWKDPISKEISKDQIDVGVWVAHADEIANRAGLIACGDVVAAAREVVREARASHTRPEGRILDLVRWGVSSAYLELRTRLGLAMVVAETKGASAAHSFSELGGLFDRGLSSRN